VKAGIQGSLDDDDSYKRDVDKDYDMCREYDNDKAKGNTPMDVDEEQHVIKEIADALESDVRTRDEMEIDKQGFEDFLTQSLCVKYQDFVSDTQGFFTVMI
jgi:hypothetical protein